MALVTREVPRILYLETLVNGKLATDIFEGDSVEFRPVYYLAGRTTYKIGLQRVGDGYVEYDWDTTEAGTWFKSFFWQISYPVGIYTIKVKVTTAEGVVAMDFTHQVLAKTGAPTAPLVVREIPFWQDENVSTPPATRLVEIDYTGNLKKATLYFSMKLVSTLLGGNIIDNVRFNAQGLSNSTSGDDGVLTGTWDVTNIIVKGRNSIQVNYRPTGGNIYLIGQILGKIDAYVRVETDGGTITYKPPTQNGGAGGGAGGDPLAGMLSMVQGVIPLIILLTVISFLPRGRG